MKRLSACLILLAACTTAFAACSSSDDSSSSGGSAGIGGASAGNGGASSGAGGRAGASGNSSGGSRANGAAGEAGESAGGTSAGSAGADSEGGAAGETSTAGSSSANGGSAGNASGGSANGGSGGTSAGSANGGSGGIAGQGANTGSQSACGDSAKTTYANGIAAYFSAHVAASGCLTPQTHGVDAAQTQECAGNGCAGSAGCSASFTWHDVSFDTATGFFTAQVDIASTLAVTGAASCSLTDGVSGKLVTIGLAVLDDDTSLDTSINGIGASGGTTTVAGCETLGNVSDIAADDLSLLVTQAEQAAISALLPYSVDCRDAALHGN